MTEQVEEKQKSEPPRLSKDPRDYIWMLKPCLTYWEEFKDCKCYQDRLHQYWVEGKMRDCTQWKTDYENCVKWESDPVNNIEALESLVDSQKERVRKRLKAHYSNTVWENRTSPPEDWNKELPDDIKAKYKGSFLELKAAEIRDGVKAIDDKEYVFTGLKCTIS